MTDKKFDQLSEQEFDLYLEEIMDSPPPEELSDEFTPWRRAMYRILWGTGMTTLTLNFLNLDTILPAIGILMMVLGYRTLRNENKWFKAAYIITILRVQWFCISVFFNSTILKESAIISDILMFGNYLWQIPLFISLLALRNGIRSVQKKAGLPPRGGTGLLIWYVAIFLLALVSFQGLMIWILLIGYICILRGLFNLSKELDEAGYAISPSPVQVSDNAAKFIYTGAVALALVIGYSCFSKYPMEWSPVQDTSSIEVHAVRQQLIDLGFPEHILDDLTDEDVLSCKDAIRVVVNVQDHPVNEGRYVTEQRPDGLYSYTDYDQEELRLTGIAVELPGGREQWKIIHHFQWVIDPGFYGTEVIHLWPAYRNGKGWVSCSDFSGQLLYNDEFQTFSAPYHSLGKETYTLDSVFWGEQTSTDVFAAFSMPKDGEDHRGYVAYSIAEAQDGWHIDAWINYTHQTSWLQFPVITAKQKHLTSGVGDTNIFNTIQDALQFFPNEENPNPID